MKKNLLMAISAILVLTFSITSVGAISGSSPEVIPERQNTVDTIDDFLNADGADAELLTDEMFKLFLEAPASFHQALNQYSTDTQQKILKRLGHCAAGSSSEERVVFETIINSSNEDLSYITDLSKYYTEALAQSYIQEITDAAPEYDMETVEQIVNSYLESGSTGNEEFFNYLFDAYQTEPDLVETTVMQHSESDIKMLTNGLAKVYKEKGSSITKSGENGSLSEKISEALNTIQDEFSEQSVAVPYATYTPQITSFSYTKKVEVGKSTPLSIKLTESSGKNTARTYTVKVYCTRDGSEWQVATTTMTIPAGSTTTTKSVNLVFTHAGTFTTRVAVYNGSTLLVTRSGKNPDVSYGKWKVVVTFKKDRRKYGTFALYNASGEQQVSGSALGLSEDNLPENKQYGNTPCGEYYGYLDGPHKNTTSFGPNKYIRTFAVDVPAIQKYNRTDAMWIHGARSQTTLQWTEGCVRVFDKSMLSMQKSITSMTRAENGHYKNGTVIYREQ